MLRPRGCDYLACRCIIRFYSFCSPPQSQPSSANTEPSWINIASRVTTSAAKLRMCHSIRWISRIFPKTQRPGSEPWKLRAA